MSLSSFLSNPRASLVADASVVINLNATARAADIIQAFPNPFAVTENACAELEAGIRNGHRDYGQLLELIAAGHAQRVHLDTPAMPVYESLISGSTLRTLDDGEAATIAHAKENGGIAVIDERKARSLCVTDFPDLVVVCTVELLMHDAVAAKLGAREQADALARAITGARMRVPQEHLARVRAMIGPERAASCASLPRIGRELVA